MKRLDQRVHTLREEVKTMVTALNLCLFVCLFVFTEKLQLLQFL